MAALTTQNIVDAGTAPTFAAPSASDTAVIGDGKSVFAVYRNTSATAVTVGIVVAGNTEYGEPNPDRSIAVPITNGEKWIPLRKAYSDGTGRATLTTTAQPAGLTVAIVRMS